MPTTDKSLINLGIDSGETPTPPIGTLADDEMLKANIGGTEIVGTGDTNTALEVDFGAKDVRCKSVITEAASVEVGPNLTISERGGYLQVHTNTTDRDFISVDYEVDATGTQKPLYDARAAEEVRVITQADDSQTMLNVTSYTLTPINDNDVIALYTKFVNPVTNFRFQVISDVTGLPIKYYPSQNDWDKGTGVAFAAGEQRAELDTPLAELTIVPITVNAMADQPIDLLGDGVNPWRAIDRQLITSEHMITETDYALESIATSEIQGGEITADTTTTVNIAAGSGRRVTIDALGVPTVEPIVWGEKLGVVVTDIATRAATRFCIDINGDVVQLPVIATPQTNRDYANIGIVGHAAGTVGKIVNAAFKSEEVYCQVMDFLQSVGITRKSGVEITGNADLSFSKTAGILSAPGAGTADGSRGQNTLPIDAEAVTSFTTILGKTDDIVLTGQNFIDPSVWDDGTGVPVAIGTPLAQSTIIYIYQSIIQPDGVFALIGQTIYPTLNSAILNAPTDRIDLPDAIKGTSNLIGRIAVRSDATLLNDILQAELLDGVQFGTGVGSGGVGSGGQGGGDYLGAASSIDNEIHIFSGTTGKVGKSGADIIALAGALSRATPNTDLTLSPNGTGAVVAGTSSFKDGDALQYPVADGLSGDSVKTNGAGGLTIAPDNYVLTSVNTTLDYDDKLIYVSALANEVTLTLGDNPRQGERKTIWIADNTFPINILSANPAFPVSPPPTVAEGNVQGLWTLGSDFLDRYNPTNRDLTLSGVGGGFVPITVNGEVVNAFDFAKNSYAVATTSAYKGVLGSSTMCISTWYQANAGQPTTLEILCGWGSGLAPNGSTFSLEMQAVNGIRVNFRSIWRQWTYASLSAANLYDGNAHNIQIIKTGAAASTVSLYIDGVFYPHTSQDNFPTPAIVSGEDFRIGSQFNGGNPVNAKLYDFRLYDRALTLTELDQIRLETLTGGAVITAAEKDMVFDMSYNGVEWALGVGTESLAITNKSRLDAVEASSLKGTGSSLTNQLVTYADETGLQAGTDADITVTGGVFNRITAGGGISLEANSGGSALMISPAGFVGSGPTSASLAHNNAAVYARDTGVIDCVSTLGAFNPPDMTTAQRLAITPPKGYVFDTDIGEQFSGNGTVWKQI